MNYSKLYIIIGLLLHVADAQDNLWLAKITQAHHASNTHSPNPLFATGDYVTFLRYITILSPDRLKNKLIIVMLMAIGDI